MSLHITIRNALPADAENISALIRGEAGYCTVNPSGEGAGHFFATITPEAIEGYITNPSFIYLLGFVAEELAGVAAIRDGKHLYHLFVASRFHRRGIASALWAQIKVKILESSTIDGLTVNSTQFAVPVYQRFGFQIQGPLVEEKGVAFVPMKLSGSHEHD